MKKLLILAMMVGLMALGITNIAANGSSTKWVDQAGGNDANDGGTEATAYATLQFAIDNSTSGTAATPSIINVKGGVYGVSGGQTNADHCGSGAFPTAILIDGLNHLTVQAVPGHEPVVQPDKAANIVSITIENSDNLIIDNIDSDQTIAQFDNWHVCNSDDLTVRNSRFEGGEDGIDLNTGLTTAMIENNTFIDINTGSGDEVLDFTDGAYSDITIQDNFFKNNYRQITISPPAGATASDFTIRRNFMDGSTSEEAVRLINAEDITLENNVIMNSSQQGIYIDTGSKNIDVLQNTFFNNDRESGSNGELRTKVTSADIVIKNNIFYANGSNPIFETTVDPLPTEDFNLVFNSPQIGFFTFGASTINGDPLFTSTTAGSEDLDLQSGSPAIGSGTNLGVPDDIEKKTRPNPVASGPDIGAYEVGLPPPPLHFLSYDVKESKDTQKFEKLTVSLADQFGAGTFEVKKVKGLYNPADKNGEGIADENTHLVGYEIKRVKGEPKHEKRTGILVENQFGQLFVDTGEPDRLLVPSLKDLDYPIDDGALPGVFPADHFKCYKVKVTKGTPKFESIQLTLSDQFGDDLYDVKKPSRLCNPVEKLVEGEEDPTKIMDPDNHLMCYQVKRAKDSPKHEKVLGLHINNQFGPLRLDTKKEKELCVPSQKEIP